MVQVAAFVVLVVLVVVVAIVVVVVVVVIVVVVVAVTGFGVLGAISPLLRATQGETGIGFPGSREKVSPLCFIFRVSV